MDRRITFLPFSPKHRHVHPRFVFAAFVRCTMAYDSQFSSFPAPGACLCRYSYPAWKHVSASTSLNANDAQNDVKKSSCCFGCQTPRHFLLGIKSRRRIMTRCRRRHCSAGCKTNAFTNRKKIVP